MLVRGNSTLVVVLYDKVGAPTHDEQTTPIGDAKIFLFCILFLKIQKKKEEFRVFKHAFQKERADSLPKKMTSRKTQQLTALRRMENMQQISETDRPAKVRNLKVITIAIDWEEILQRRNYIFYKKKNKKKIFFEFFFFLQRSLLSAHPR